MRKPALLWILLLGVGLTACGKKEEPNTMAEPAAPAPMAEAPAPAAAPEGGAMESASAGGEVDAPAKFASTCAVCHGATGEGMGKTPSLVLSRDQIKSKLMDYRAGKQMGAQTAIMAPIAKKLSDEEIEALANYLGS